MFRRPIGGVVRRIKIRECGRGIVDEFVAKYEKKYGAKPDSLAALGYDAMRVLADAMRRAGPDFDSTKLRDAIAATKDFPVVTGTITFDRDRNPVGKRVVDRRDPQRRDRAAEDDRAVIPPSSSASSAPLR